VPDHLPEGRCALDPLAPALDDDVPPPSYDVTAPRSREERDALTLELLAASRRTQDQVERARLLDEVVLLNRGVAEAVANRYRNRGAAQEDLEQAAMEGLVKAVHRFDPTIRPDLLTYAVPTIRGEVQRWFRDEGWMVRPPRRIQDLQWRIGRSVERLAQELGREPTDAEVGDDLGVPENDVGEASRAYGSFAPTSLDQAVSADGSTTFGDLVAGAEPEHGPVEARLVLRPALRRLPERDRRILYLRFVEEQSQTEIGAEMGVTQMQVSRLLSRILRDLRSEIR
jgi:RNA polymerase sigma-B factor